MKQTLIYTTLPNGKVTIQGTQYLKISLLCGMRLSHTSATTISQFPGIQAWAGKIKNTEGFKVRWNGASPVDAIAETAVIDPEVWETLVHPEVKVSDFIVEDKTKLQIHAFPVKELNESLLNVYREFGVKNPVNKISPTQFLQNQNVSKIGRISVNRQVIDTYARVARPTAGRAALRNELRQAVIDPKTSVSDNSRNSLAMEYRSIMQAGNYAGLAAKNSQTDFQFTRFRDFHRIDLEQRAPLLARPELPDFDFHDILSQMSDYPQMQRKLGLVIDLMVPFDGNLPLEGQVSAFPFGLEFDQETEISVTATAYRLTANGFYAREKPNSELHNGFVKLNTPGFSVEVIDTDGAAIQTINKVDEQLKVAVDRTLKVQSRVLLMTSEEDDVDDEDDENTEETDAAEGLPVLRSSGIAIIKNQVETYLNTRFLQARQLDLKLGTIKPIDTTLKTQNIQLLGIVKKPDILLINIPDTEVFYADDLLMGYRMDVAYADAPEAWYSLHHKQDEVVVYDENKNASPVTGLKPDEGFCQMATTEDSENKDNIFVSGVIARWTGWSLAVERPGLAINEPEAADGKDFVHPSQTEEDKKYGYHPESNVRMNVRSQLVPGTLPALRYGKSYNLRMRYVDVAGNSVAPETTPDQPAEAIVKNILYRRYEPVSTPIMLAGNQLKVGEDIERLIIKSNVGVDAADYAEPGVAPADRVSKRLFIPPQNSQLTAERHGKFDAAFKGNAAEAQAIYNLIITHEMAPGTGEAEDKVYVAEDFVLTYLPDPAATGIAFFLADGYDETHSQVFTPLQIQFVPAGKGSGVNGWLQVEPVTLKLAEGAISSNWNESTRTLTFFLPKGHRAKIKYSSFWQENDLREISGLWKHLSEGVDFSTIRDHLIKGSHWMVSPSRELELVHAVQQPLAEPQLTDTIAERGYLDTPAWIKTKIKVDGQSTSQVELDATWKEWVDDPLAPLPTQVNNQVRLDPVKIKYKEQTHYLGYAVPKNPSFQIINTVVPVMQLQQPGLRPAIQPARTVQPRIAAQPVTQPANPVMAKPVMAQRAFTTSNARTMQLLPKFSSAYILKTWGLMHGFEDTRHRFVDYKPVASTRYPEFFRTKNADGDLIPLAGLDFTRTGIPATVNILSSDRPLPPEVEYILPTFNWQKMADKDRLTHIRKGGGLRVYLKRPWFSSGDGEQLAVVLGTGQASTPEYPPRFSQWGVDPIFPYPGNAEFMLTRNHFNWQSKTDDNLVYPGAENLKANVAAFPVKFDAERKLWYADLMIDPKERYFPFVKLMLARYQEHSLRISNSDVCLSKVVETDFVQLVPERKVQLVIERKGGQANRLKIEISGFINQDYNRNGNPLPKEANSFEVKIMSEEIPQPISGVISNALPDKKTITQEAQINEITYPDPLRFVATGYFQLTPELRKVPFDVIVLEYEKADMEGATKLVFADEFSVNREEKK
jgi:hypothetical protein